MDACEAADTASPWKLGQPVREIAEGGAAQDRDQAHARGSDTGPRVQTVQQKHYAGGGYGRGCEECDADCHRASVGHIKESIVPLAGQLGPVAGLDDLIRMKLSGARPASLNEPAARA